MKTLRFLSRWAGLLLVQSFSGLGVSVSLLAVCLAWLCASPALAQTEMPLYVFPSSAAPIGALTQGRDGNFYGTTSFGGVDDDGTVYRISTNGTFTNLYSFTNGNDGARPNAGLVQGSDGNFYGTTTGGGYGYGTIFQITTNGAFTVLHTMQGNTEGGLPYGSLVQASDHGFYGTAKYDGPNSGGTIFKVTTDGILTVVHAFSGPDGQNPDDSLALGPDGNFYGTCESGGSSTNGTVFRITPGGVFTNLHSFNGMQGSLPYSGLVLGVDGAFYGTTELGGAGTVFRITINGVFTALHFFGSGHDGGVPYGTLVQTADGILYGTTSAGGANHDGIVFQITTNGVETVLYSFTTGDVGGSGLGPESGLTVGRDGKLYGTLYNGGTNEYGAVFAFTRFTSGTVSSIYSFVGATKGAYPYGGLTTGPDGNLYGTTSAGGNSVGTGGNGTIFRLSLTPTNSVFASLHVFNGTDGLIPYAPLALDPNGILYGTTQSGGTDSSGNVFGITTNGVFTNVYSFTGGNDGAVPYDGLLIGLNGALDGTTELGGAYSAGNVFELTTNGLCTNIYSFTGGNDGYAPYGGLIQDTAGNLYGTALSAGSKEDGTIFEITNNGGFTTLYSFGGSDGAGPEYGLIFGPDGALYGTTPSGGTNGGYGTAFRITTNGVFTSLHSFSNGNDGGNPHCTLFLGSDTNFYGTCENGGSGTNGTLFQMSPDGVVTTLHAFDKTDGSSPVGQLALGGDGNLYGVTSAGGNNNLGTIFGLSNLFPSVAAAPGSLAVTLGPDAVTNQAQWMIDDNGTNLASGVTISNLSAGYHQIYFLSVSNWTEPNCQVVFISPNALTGASGVYVTSLPSPPNLIGATLSANGVFQFSFTNSHPNASFSVWESTNPALPLVDWTDIGAASSLGGGMFQFTDTQATNSQRYYSVSSP